MGYTTGLEVNVSLIQCLCKVSLNSLIDSVDIENISKNVLKERNKEGGGIRVGTSLVIVKVVHVLHK